MTESSEPARPDADEESRLLPPAVRHAVDAALDKQAMDVVALDLREAQAFTDYFVLCSGRTPRHVRAIVDAIEERLRDSGMTRAHTEGYAHAAWVLIDCFDCVIHVFAEDTRRFYDLERLWGSARRFEYATPPPPDRVGDR